MNDPAVSVPSYRRMREEAAQLSFEMPVQKRRGRGRASLYAAVVFLRRKGFTVYTTGRQHKINGRLASNSQLLAMAAAQGWR